MDSQCRTLLPCLLEQHRPSDCQEKIECSICQDIRHTALFHRARARHPARNRETVDANCTSTCSATEGGVSSSKRLLADVYSKVKPHIIHREYAIIDEQSNSFQISSQLADELGAVGPKERYYLTTCSGEKEIKYGRRVTDVVKQSLSGTASDLPAIIDCSNIPQDKRE